MQSYVIKLQEQIEKLRAIRDQEYHNPDYVKIQALTKEILKRAFPSEGDKKASDFSWAWASMVIKSGHSSDYEKQKDYTASIDGKITFLEAQIEILSLDLPSVNVSIWDIQLHPEIYASVVALFNDWHYFNAVENAYKIVREKLRKLTGEEQAHKAFAVSNTIFQQEPENDAEKDFREGVRFLHMAIQNFRNEKAHSLHDLERNRAMHYITLASLAMILVEQQ